MEAKIIPPKKEDLIFDSSNIKQVEAAKRFLVKAKFSSINPSVFIPGMCMQFSNKKYFFVRSISLNESGTASSVFSIMISERLHIFENGSLQPIPIYEYDASGTITLETFKDFYCDSIRKMLYSIYDSGFDGNEHSPFRYLGITPESETVTGELKVWNKGGLEFKFNDSTTSIKYQYISNWTNHTDNSQAGTKSLYWENDDSFEPITALRLSYTAKFNSI